MKIKSYRRVAMLSVAAATLAALSAPLAAQAQQAAYSFNIPAQDLGSALRAYAKTTRQQVSFNGEAVRGKTSVALVGRFDADAGLRSLLGGAGLGFSRGAHGVILVEPAGPQSAGARPEPERTTAVEEVVVTAKTGTQKVRSISGSVSALSGAQLQTIGAQSFQDYLTRTPGVVFNAAVPGISTASIRGVATTTSISNNQGTTGYFINDVPLTDPFNSAGIPDIDAFDVDDVTILRGPQGTLFGAASLGGAINYQAAAPNLSTYDAHVQATIADTKDGGAGGAGKVMVNIPIKTDTLAVRGVYVYRSDAGYIDNVGTGQKDSNRTELNGGRIEVEWAPTASTRVNYLFLEQTQDTRDAGYQEPILAGPLRKDTNFAEPTNLRTIIHSLRVDQDLGPATLTATATYHRKTLFSDSDLTAEFAPFLPGLDPVHVAFNAASKGETFEVRLASHPGGRLDYLVGAYYDDTRENLLQSFQSANAVSVIDADFGGVFGPGIGEATAPGGVFFQGGIPFHGKELAGFGEATYHFNDALKLTLGGRAFNTKADSATTVGGFFELLSSGVLTSTLAGKQSQSGVAPKASLTWTPNGDFMAYALASKGYRFGGPNVNASSPGFTIPPGFNSDSLWNYEVGVRSNWFDNRLQLDATAFYIDWSDIQLQLFSPFGLAYLANAGKARDYGVEGTATLKLTPELTFQSNFTYLNAELAEDFDPGAGQPIIPDGSTLPGASRWQVANTLIYQWKGGLRPVVVLSHRYLSRAPGDFQVGTPQGGYNQFDARATLHFDRFDLSAFAQNIGNSHAVTAGSLQTPLPLEQFILRPFTAGLTFDFKM
jgi:outer membrane receptor protein involved in Fe transport